MASIHEEIRIDTAPEQVWEALATYGAVHTRLAPGFVTDTRLDGDTRIVTFANGMVARERIVDARRQGTTPGADSTRAACARSRAPARFRFPSWPAA